MIKRMVKHLRVGANVVVQMSLTAHSSTDEDWFGDVQLQEVLAALHDVLPALLKRDQEVFESDVAAKKSTGKAASANDLTCIYADSLSMVVRLEPLRNWQSFLSPTTHTRAEKQQHPRYMSMRLLRNAVIVTVLQKDRTTTTSTTTTTTTTTAVQPSRADSQLALLKAAGLPENSSAVITEHTSPVRKAGRVQKRSGREQDNGAHDDFGVFVDEREASESPEKKRLKFGEADDERGGEKEEEKEEEQEQNVVKVLEDESDDSDGDGGEEGTERERESDDGGLNATQLELKPTQESEYYQMSDQALINSVKSLVPHLRRILRGETPHDLHSQFHLSHRTRRIAVDFAANLAAHSNFSERQVEHISRTLRETFCSKVPMGVPYVYCVLMPETLLCLSAKFDKDKSNM